MPMQRTFVMFNAVSRYRVCSYHIPTCMVQVPDESIRALWQEFNLCATGWGVSPKFFDQLCQAMAKSIGTEVNEIANKEFFAALDTDKVRGETPSGPTNHSLLEYPRQGTFNATGKRLRTPFFSNPIPACFNFRFKRANLNHPRTTSSMAWSSCPRLGCSRGCRAKTRWAQSGLKCREKTRGASPVVCCLGPSEKMAHTARRLLNRPHAHDLESGGVRVLVLRRGREIDAQHERTFPAAEKYLGRALQTVRHRRPRLRAFGIHRKPCEKQNSAWDQLSVG